MFVRPTGEASACATTAFATQQAEYEAALSRTLQAACRGDRRTGLANLFWLAHSQQVAQTLHELRRKAGAAAPPASLAAFLASFTPGSTRRRVPRRSPPTPSWAASASAARRTPA